MRPTPSCARLAAALCAVVCTAHADPVITEFLADNVAGLTDEDGAYSDWIEMHNPDAAPLNLDGWFLTDSASAPAKWRFPAVTVPAGGFVVVWASGKDRRVAGAPLHTNFSLRAAGEYLALVRPDGATVVQQFAPEFPSQDPDRSYGVSFSGTPLLSEGATMKYRVPASGGDGTTWTAPAYSDTAWASGQTGAGYGILVNGITVREVRKGVAPLSNLAETDALLALAPGSAGIQSERTVISPVVNFYHDGGEGHYTGNLVFPNGGGDYFAVKATGFIQVSAAQAGAWTFGLNSDDGGRIRIDGTDCMVDDTNHGPSDHLGTRTLTAGLHSFEVVYWEQGGGAGLEFFAAPGSLAAWTASFKLVGDTAGGGLAAFTYPSGVATSGGFVRTDLQPVMHGINPGVYFRVPFNVTSPAAFGSLQLSVRYNDGFIAFLNGAEIARRNAPVSPVWNSTATASRTTEQSVSAEAINVTAHLPSLMAGNNLLSIHGLNSGVSDGSFLLLPEMTASGPLGAGPSVYFNAPTPGAINGQASSLGKVADTAFSADRGFYSAPVSVAITTPTADAVIRYTTDGSPPTATTGTLYTAPLTISTTTTLRAAAYKTGWDPTNVDTHTYIFPDDVIRQSASGTPPAGWPAGPVNGQVYDYGMDPAIVDSTNTAIGGAQQVKSALLAIPSFSIVLEQSALTGPSGIYSNPGGRGFAWERPCSLELLNDGANGPGFQINAGLRLRGGYSRQTSNPKHSFHFRFRGDYGASKLNYPLHGDEGTSEFDELGLRTSQNYSWSLHGDGGSNTFLREEWTRMTQGAMGQPYSRGRYFHLYLNGQYWGLFDSEERAEAGHAEAYFGGQQEDYDVVKSTGSPGGYTTELVNGTMPAWQSLWDQAMAMRTDPGNARYFQLQGLAPDGVTPLNNPAWPRLLDVNNQIDYMLLVFWAGSSDAPLTGGADRVNNWFAYRRRDSDMGFLHFAHDMEHSCFGGDRTGPYNNASVTSFTYANPQYLHEHMMGNAEYRLRWADRVHRHMFNDGALTPARNLARANALAATVSSAIIAESARWGDAKIEPPRDKTHWEGARNTFLNFIPARHNEVLNQLRTDGLYPALATPALSQWGGYISSAQQLYLNAPAGTIYYTVNGADPRVIGGAIHGSAQVFTSATTTDTFIPMGSAALLTPWKYLVTNVDQGSAWRTPAFNDSSWSTGNTEMGYGDADQVTVIEDDFTPGVPASSGTRFITTYFRKTFSVTNPAQYSDFTITVERDDGAVVYLNGEEIARPGMPPLPAAIGWSTPASGAIEDTTDIIPVPVSKIVSGVNVIAVEIHQSSAGSSDISFNCSVTGTKTNATTPLYLPPGETTVRARTYDSASSTWSALAETTFLVNAHAAAAGNLVISEIMYHPADPNAAEIAAGFNDPGDFEYIELTNASSTHYADLANVRFTGGIGFDFDASLVGRLLAPGARVLLVKNSAAFTLRYGPGLPVAGEFSGSLDNVGEQLQFVGATGAVIANFAFADAEPWPPQADGSGRSLVLRRLNGDPAQPQSWRASVVDIGNPGAGDAVDYAAWKAANNITDDNSDADKDGLTAFAEYAAAGDPAASSQHRWPAGGLDDAQFHTMTVTLRAGADDVELTPETSTGLSVWTATMVFVRSVMNGDGTESITWRTADSVGSVPRLQMRCRLSLRQ